MIARRTPALLAGALLLTAAAPEPASPWFGTWKLRLADPKERPETLVYSDAGNGAMRMESVEDRSELVTRFDGKPAADTGAGATGRNALAITATSRTSYRWIFLKDGKPFVAGRNAIAADGRSFTEVSWRVETPGETRTFVYDRQ